MDKRDIIIAIDGHSSTGKSTFAKAISKSYGLIYVDTGALYRGVTLVAARNNASNMESRHDIEKLSDILQNVSFEFLKTAPDGSGELHLNGENIEKEIRSLEIAQKVSEVASQPFVRDFVDSILKEYGTKRGVVMDGRDIGTVVFPEAELKSFMTASPEIRADRRFSELRGKGVEVSYEEVLHNTKERDRLDQGRVASPLKQADDALVLDNSYLNREEQLEWMIQKVHAIIQRQ
ncbi:MAG: (d)CMP kinase [Bacteroidia bacterium]|nr:(d)CMP kinase [Bacteroidia bacterium]